MKTIFVTLKVLFNLLKYNVKLKLKLQLRKQLTAAI